MSFNIRKAAPEGRKLLAGLAGGTGSGKTYSALLMARGLVGPDGKVVVIDTENGRACHYADEFEFDVIDFAPPFTPARYQEAMQAAVDAGADAVIVDSGSHSWEGTGGAREWADKIAHDMAAKWNKSPDAYTFPSWREPKIAYSAWVNFMLQVPTHVILCFRAKEKKGMKGREIIDLGWQPITEASLPFEMTFLAMMTADQPGVPQFTYKALTHKLKHVFPQGKQLTEDHGRLLAEWAQGGGEAPKPEPRQKGATKAEEARQKAEEYVSMMADAYGRAQSVEELDAVDERAGKNLQRLKTNHADLYERVEEAYRARWAEVAEPQLGGDDTADADMFEAQEEAP